MAERGRKSCCGRGDTASVPGSPCGLTAELPLLPMLSSCSRAPRTRGSAAWPLPSFLGTADRKTEQKRKLRYHRHLVQEVPALLQGGAGTQEPAVPQKPLLHLPFLWVIWKQPGRSTNFLKRKNVVHSYIMPHASL